MGFRNSRATIAIAALLVIAALCWACFFNGIATLYPVDKTEALQLEIARHMGASGDWVTPTVDGHPYFEKPPLPYWIGGLLLERWPLQVWLPRLGSALAGCLGVGATLVLCRQGFADGHSPQGLRRSVTAAAILALMPGYFVMARTAVHDIYLTATTTVALAVVFLLSQAPVPSRRRQWLGGGLVGLCLGVGLLAKGLLSLAVPSVTALVFLAVAGAGARRAFSSRFWIALVLALLLVALPWHLAAWQANGAAFLQGYFLRSHFSRVGSTLDGHAGPWFYYLPAYLLISFPWAITAMVVLGRQGCLDPRHWRRRLEDQPLLVFCAIWIGVTVGLLSLASTKLPHYILAALPPTAIASGCFLWPHGQARAPGRRFSQALVLAFSALLLLTALVLLLVPGLVVPESRSHPAFGLALRSLLTSPAVILGIGGLGLLGSAASWLKRDQHLVLAGLWATTTLLFLVLLLPPLLQLYRQEYQQPRLVLADRALQEARPDEAIRVVGKSWYSIAIRTQGRAVITRHYGADRPAEARQPVAALQPCQPEGPSTLVLGPTETVHDVEQRLGPIQLLESNPEAELTLGRLCPAAESSTAR